MADTHESKCARSNRALIGEALADLVAAAKGGGPRTRIGLMVAGGEVPAEEYLRGASLAMRRDPRIQAVGLGPKPDGLLPDDMDWIETPACEADMAAAMEKALESTGPGALQGAVALHYPFPVGVATLGRIQTPARGRPMILASSTASARPTGPAPCCATPCTGLRRPRLWAWIIRVWACSTWRPRPRSCAP